MNKTLDELIDFSRCKSTREIETQFDNLAEVLINGTEFSIRKTPFRITDIELALNIPGLIEDELHCSTLQTSPLRFYVHRKNAKSYKAGKIIGLDITAGGIKNEAPYYGTILIKGIEVQGATALVQGPGKVLNGLVRGFEQESLNFSKWNDEELNFLKNIDEQRIDSPILNFKDGLENFQRNTIHLSKRASFNKASSEFIYNENILHLRATTEKTALKTPPREKPSPSEHKQPEQTTNNGQQSKIMTIESKSFIEKYLQLHDLEIGGSFFNEKNLIPIKTLEDLSFISPDLKGCYFIFSDMPEKEIPTFSKDGYRCNKKEILHPNGITYRCLYNGKAQNIRSRLKHHLFNSHTLLKIRNQKQKNNTLSGTGAISLEAISLEEAKQLERAGMFNPNKQKLKPVSKALNKEVSHVTFEGKQFLLNGIDITEPHWRDRNFAIFIVANDNELGKILVEEAFATTNGRPPLCRRHG